MEFVHRRQIGRRQHRAIFPRQLRRLEDRLLQLRPPIVSRYFLFGHVRIPSVNMSPSRSFLLDSRTTLAGTSPSAGVTSFSRRHRGTSTSWPQTLLSSAHLAEAHP